MAAAIDSASVVEAARECLGTRYKHQGRLVGVGLDCIGVAIYAARKVGIEVQDAEPGYSRSPQGLRLVRALEDHGCVRVPVAEMSVGDILLMAWESDPQHVAIVSEISPAPMIIHSTAQYRSVVEHILDDAWLRRVRAVYRMPEGE